MNQLNPQYLTTRPFARVHTADALPGHCIRCPRNTDLVDLGAPSIQNFGVVYICTVCLGDLMNQMKVVTAEVHQNAVQALADENTVLHGKLSDAVEAKNAPIEFITAHLKEFTDVVDLGARNLIAGLGSYSAPRDPGHDHLAATAADADEPADADLPEEPAAGDGDDVERIADRPALSDPVVVGDDDGEALIAALLGTDAVPAAPAGADEGTGDGDVVLGESGDILGELYGDAAR